MVPSEAVGGGGFGGIIWGLFFGGGALGAVWRVLRRADDFGGFLGVGLGATWRGGGGLEEDFKHLWGGILRPFWGFSGHFGGKMEETWKLGV